MWTALDPESQRLLGIDVGPRTLAMAQRVVPQLVQVVAPGCGPLFLTDGLKDDATALLRHVGFWMQPARRPETGPRPNPRWMALPRLLYAQVVQSYRRRRIVGVTHRVGCGTLEQVKAVLAACAWQSNTAFVERRHLDIRQRVAAGGRRGNTLGKGEDGLQHPLVLFQV